MKKIGVLINKLAGVKTCQRCGRGMSPKTMVYCLDNQYICKRCLTQQIRLLIEKLETFIFNP